MYSNTTYCVHLLINDPVTGTKHDWHYIIIKDYHCSYFLNTVEKLLGHDAQFALNWCKITGYISELSDIYQHILFSGCNNDK